jgi:hypothetical protein
MTAANVANTSAISLILFGGSTLPRECSALGNRLGACQSHFVAQFIAEARGAGE